MVVDKDFLVRIRTASNEELRNMLLNPNLTEEQRQIVMEELRLRGYEEGTINYYPQEEETLSTIVSNIKWFFEKYQIPYRLGLQSYQLEGFMNPKDYLLLLRAIEQDLRKRGQLSWTMEQDLMAIYSMIKRAVGEDSGEEPFY